MKKNKYFAIVLVLILSMSMMLTGCGIIDSINYMADGIAEAVMGGNRNSRDDDEDDEEDDDDDDDDDGHGHNNNHGNGGGQLAYVPVEEQYQLLVDIRDRWYLDEIDYGNRYSISYAVTDLDDNGRIEIIQELYDYYSYTSEFVVLEVNADCDGLNAVDFMYNGHAMPDLSDIYYAYETNDGLYYSSYCYTSTADEYYVEYYMIKMENGLIVGDLLKYCIVDTDTYDYVYYDAAGNVIGDDEFYDIDESDYLSSYSYESRYVDMQYDYDIAYPNDDATDVDLYYFLEHGYTVFYDRDLTFGSYDGELTIYTDPSSAEYQALEDVVVINEGAHGTPVRFKASADASFGVVDGYWNDWLECFYTDNYCYEIYYNRVYELILDLDNKNSQAVMYGYCMMLVNEENFGSHRGTYTINVDTYNENELTEDSTYVQALGIVAYEIYKAGSELDFTEDEDLYYKTMSEVISYIYDLRDDEIALSYLDYNKIEDSFFYWNWEIYTYDTYDSDYVIEYHYDEDHCSVMGASSYSYGAHYLITSTDYTEALDAVDSIDIYYNSDGTVNSIEYNFIGNRGNIKTVTFDISGDYSSAFGAEATYMVY